FIASTTTGGTKASKGLWQHGFRQRLGRNYDRLEAPIVPGIPTRGCPSCTPKQCDDPRRQRPEVVASPRAHRVTGCSLAVDQALPLHNTGDGVLLHASKSSIPES